jgi:hypothetical protein
VSGPDAEGSHNPGPRALSVPDGAYTRPVERHAPVSITSAPAALSDDVAARTRRYLVQMSIRMVCFAGAVLVDHWTRWVLLVGAVVLPYIAVVLANAGRERRAEPASLTDVRPALEGRGTRGDAHTAD